MNKRIRLPSGKDWLIYLLGAYVLLQFGWWAYMLVDLNAEIYDLRFDALVASDLSAPEVQMLKAELDRKLSLRIWMVLGEGSVFMFLLLLGFYSVRKSIVKELRLARQQKNFLLSVTHELRSPLAAIKLQMQTLLRRDLDRERAAQLYARALHDAERLEKLVENLLLVNRLESGRSVLDMHTVCLTELVNEWLTNVNLERPDAEHVQADIEQDVHVKGDELALQSIFLNLLDNAFKYAPGAEVSIALRADEKEATLIVADRGAGVPEKDKRQVFERFYRAGSEETRKTKGTGIGLYLVRQLAETHGGSVSVSDNTPSGAVFTLKLPRTEP